MNVIEPPRTVSQPTQAIGKVENMKRVHQHLSEVEVTAWVLLGIFLAALLTFSFLFWKQISREASRPSQSVGIVQLGSR